MRHVIVDLVAIIAVAVLAFAHVVDGTAVVGIISGIVFARYRPPASVNAPAGGLQTIASMPKSFWPRSFRPKPNEHE